MQILPGFDSLYRFIGEIPALSKFFLRFNAHPRLQTNRHPDFHLGTLSHHVSSLLTYISTFTRRGLKRFFINGIYSSHRLLTIKIEPKIFKPTPLYTRSNTSTPLFQPPLTKLSTTLAHPLTPLSHTQSSTTSSKNQIILFFKQFYTLENILHFLITSPQNFSHIHMQIPTFTLTLPPL